MWKYILRLFKINISEQSQDPENNSSNDDKLNNSKLNTDFGKINDASDHQHNFQASTNIVVASTTVCPKFSQSNDQQDSLSGSNLCDKSIEGDLIKLRDADICELKAINEVDYKAKASPTNEENEIISEDQAIYTSNECETIKSTIIDTSECSEIKSDDLEVSHKDTCKFEIGDCTGSSQLGDEQIVKLSKKDALAEQYILEGISTNEVDMNVYSDLLEAEVKNDQAKKALDLNVNLRENYGLYYDEAENTSEKQNQSYSEKQFNDEKLVSELSIAGDHFTFEEESNAFELQIISLPVEPLATEELYSAKSSSSVSLCNEAGNIISELLDESDTIVQFKDENELSVQSTNRDNLTFEERETMLRAHSQNYTIEQSNKEIKCSDELIADDFAEMQNVISSTDAGIIETEESYTNKYSSAKVVSNENSGIIFGIPDARDLVDSSKGEREPEITFSANDILTFNEVETMPEMLSTNNLNWQSKERRSSDHSTSKEDVVVEKQEINPQTETKGFVTNSNEEVKLSSEKYNSKEALNVCKATESDFIKSEFINKFGSDEDEMPHSFLFSNSATNVSNLSKDNQFKYTSYLDQIVTENYLHDCKSQQVDSPQCSFTINKGNIINEFPAVDLSIQSCPVKTNLSEQSNSEKHLNKLEPIIYEFYNNPYADTNIAQSDTSSCEFTASSSELKQFNAPFGDLSFKISPENPNIWIQDAASSLMDSPKMQHPDSSPKPSQITNYSFHEYTLKEDLAYYKPMDTYSSNIGVDYTNEFYSDEIRKETFTPVISTNSYFVLGDTQFKMPPETVHDVTDSSQMKMQSCENLS